MIGLYGGTFDPIHNGHLHVIKELLESKRFEKIIVIPSSNPLLKSAPIASGKDRLDICALAISELKVGDAVEVSDFEIVRAGPSFAIDTVRQFIEMYPDKEFSWIIGSDAYSKIDQWHEAQALVELVSFLVIERPEDSDSDSDSDSEDGYDSYGYVDIDALAISATDIRAKLSKGESIAELAPQSVVKYINERKLYGGA